MLMLELRIRLSNVRCVYINKPTARRKFAIPYRIRFSFLVGLFFLILAAIFSLIMYVQMWNSVMKLLISSKAPNEKNTGPSA